MRRLLEEDVEILVYCKESLYRRIGVGIVPISFNFEEWMKWGLKDPNTLFFFDFTDDGDLAERLRSSGKLVLCGGKFQDMLEKKREEGEDIAKKAGILCPPTYQFATVSQSIAFLSNTPEQEAGDGGWAWKPNKSLGCDTTLVTSDEEEMIRGLQHIQRQYGDNLKCIIQERIPGVALSTARWWNGKSWTGPYWATLEEKKFLVGDKGPATGCSLNTVWFYEEKEPEIARALKFQELEGLFRAKAAAPGIYDINSIVNNEGAWFLEWTPRLGYDSEMTSQRAVSNLGTLLWNVATGQGIDELFDTTTLYHGVHVSVPPYPNYIDKLDNKSPALGIPVYGIDGFWEGYFVASGVAFDPSSGITVASPPGYVGTIVCANDSVEEGYEDIYDYIDEELQIQNLQYRTDAAKNVNDDMIKLKQYGWKVHSKRRK